MRALRQQIGFRLPGGRIRPARQYGAIPWRWRGSGPELLLITARGSGRWIFPKGWPIAGLRPEETAARETFEEAGVEGSVAARPLGRYRILKQYRGRLTPIEVALFPLEVERELADWPERTQRRRRWASPAEAARLVQDPGLRRLIARFERCIAREQRSVAGSGRA